MNILYTYRIILLSRKYGEGRAHPTPKKLQIRRKTEFLMKPIAFPFKYDEIFIFRIQYKYFKSLLTIINQKYTKNFIKIKFLKFEFLVLIEKYKENFHKDEFFESLTQNKESLNQLIYTRLPLSIYILRIISNLVQVINNLEHSSRENVLKIGKSKIIQ